MSTTSRLFPRFGGLGIAYAVLLFVTEALLGSEPGGSAHGSKVISYYASHRGSTMAGVFTAVFACLAFICFLAALRRRLVTSSDGSDLTPIVMAGGAIYVMGLLVMAALAVALTDAAHDGASAAAQALNVLSNDAWVPVVAGLSITALGTGLAGLRNHTLPTWLAWASIGLAVLSVAGPAGGLAFLIAPVWAAILAIVLIRSDRSDRTAASAAGPVVGSARRSDPVGGPDSLLTSNG